MRRAQDLNRRFNALSINVCNVYHDLIVESLYTIDTLASEGEDFSKELNKLELIVKSAELLHKSFNY